MTPFLRRVLWSERSRSLAKICVAGIAHSVEHASDVYPVRYHLINSWWPLYLLWFHRIHRCTLPGLFVHQQVHVVIVQGGHESDLHVGLRDGDRSGVKLSTQCPKLWHLSNNDWNLYISIKAYELKIFHFEIVYNSYNSLKHKLQN